LFLKLQIFLIFCTVLLLYCVRNFFSPFFEIFRSSSFWDTCWGTLNQTRRLETYKHEYLSFYGTYRDDLGLILKINNSSIYRPCIRKFNDYINANIFQVSAHALCFPKNIIFVFYQLFLFYGLSVLNISTNNLSGISHSF